MEDKRLFTEFKPSHTVQTIKEDGALSDVFKEHILPRLPQSVSLATVCKSFHSFFEEKKSFERIKKIDQNLRGCHFKLPYYYLKFLENIQSFRRFKLTEKKQRICEIFNAIEETEEAKKVQGYIQKLNAEQLSFFYQGYKEGFFNQLLIQKCKADIVNFEESKQPPILFKLTKEKVLSCLRKGVVTIDELFSFLSYGEPVNFELNDFGVREYIGDYRLRDSLDVLQNEKKKSIKDLMEMPWMKIKQSLGPPIDTPHHIKYYYSGASSSYY